MCENTPSYLEIPTPVLVFIRPFRQFSRIVWIVDAPVSDSAYKSLRIVCIAWYVSLSGCVVYGVYSRGRGDTLYIRLDCGYPWCWCFLSLLFFFFTWWHQGQKNDLGTTGFLLFYCFAVWFASMIDQADLLGALIDHITCRMTFSIKKVFSVVFCKKYVIL